MPTVAILVAGGSGFRPLFLLSNLGRLIAGSLGDLVARDESPPWQTRSGPMAIYVEPDAGGNLDPRSLVATCIEGAARAILLDEQLAPDDFFDLSTGFAGELLHGLSKYGLRLAVVVPDPAVHSRPFQDFCRETNRGSQFRTFATRARAVEWLESGTSS